MVTIRRLYIYLVSAISLQVVTWALVWLLRNGLLGSALHPSASSLSFEIALVLVGAPFYLVHWLWAQSLARREAEENTALLRRLYLYGTLAGALGPSIANLFDLLGNLVHLSGTLERQPAALNIFQGVIYHAAALVVLGGVWLYHYRIVHRLEKPAGSSTGGQAGGLSGGAAVIRRWYTYAFGAVGLAMTSLGVIHLLRWLMLQFSTSSARLELDAFPFITLSEIIRLAVGLPLWLVFWLTAQRRFRAEPDEQESALRKFFLYAAVFAGTLGVVVNASLLLAGFLRALLGLPSQGDLSDPLPIILAMGVVWVYYSFVLREDARSPVEQAGGRKAGIERLYRYLVAAIGLGALLTGLAGLIQVLISAISSSSLEVGLREQLAWFSAALIAGLPVWLLPWRQSEQRAYSPAPESGEERRSLARRIYLYFYIFIATLAALSGAVFILFRLIGQAMGENPATLTELGLAIAYALLAVVVWLYHGSEIWRDGRLNNAESSAHTAQTLIAILDEPGSAFGPQAQLSLQQELPGLRVSLLSTTDDEAALSAGLSQASGVILPLPLALRSLTGAALPEPAAALLAASPARRLVVPVANGHHQPEGLPDRWEVAGVDLEAEAARKQMLHAVRQILAGAPVRPSRPLGAGPLAAMLFGGLVLLVLVYILIVGVMNMIIPSL